MKPKTTLTEFIQPPDLGISFSKDGKKAKMEKGRARPRAKPPMPTAGPTMEPLEAASTRSVPIMGPVHEKETRTRVNAMKKMLSTPEVDSALPSAALLHLEGNLMSKAPKNEMAKRTRRAKNIRLNTALVAISLSLPAPNISVIAMPSIRNMTMMESPYIRASPMERDLLRFS